MAIRAFSRFEGESLLSVEVMTAAPSDLSGFNRLRVGGLRIIFRQTRPREIRLEYANNRDVIYELYRETPSGKAFR
jgi:hypothetical protein